MAKQSHEYSKYYLKLDRLINSTSTTFKSSMCSINRINVLLHRLFRDKLSLASHRNVVLETSYGFSCR